MQVIVQYTMSSKLLVVNPNSSKSMTDALKPLIKPIPSFEIDYYTGPPSSPPEIDGYETSKQSTEACFPELKDKVADYDGILIACYSDHPLIYKLKEITSKPILGIFQSTILYSLTYTPTNKFAILTSNHEWEKILDLSLYEFFNGRLDKGHYDDDIKSKLPQFAIPTLASNVNVLELKDPAKFKKLQGKVDHLVDQGAKLILLGCAGLSGLDEKFGPLYPDIIFVDSVKVGIQLLVALVNFERK